MPCHGSVVRGRGLSASADIVIKSQVDPIELSIKMNVGCENDTRKLEMSLYLPRYCKWGADVWAWHMPYLVLWGSLGVVLT